MEIPNERSHSATSGIFHPSSSNRLNARQGLVRDKSPQSRFEADSRHHAQEPFGANRFAGQLSAPARS
jgi:hypothetical protein